MNWKRLTRYAIVATITLFVGTVPARAADYTDIWYVASEPGWGANVVQSDSFLFVTFFIYGADGRPSWYTAQLSWNGADYSGGLYSTAGTYWALPWVNPTAIQQVGTARFTPNALNVYQATLTWTVNGVGTVTKAIERQTLTSIGLGGSYVGGQTGAYSGCTSAGDNGSYVDRYTLGVAQASGVATFTFVYGDAGATCTMSGNLEQHGQTYRIPLASYKCTGGIAFETTATMYEIKATSLGLEGRFAATLPNACREDANFAAVLR